MKKLILISKLFILALCFTTGVLAQTSGTLTCSFTEISKSPTYTGLSDHAIAVWVQTNAGGFVKTKLRNCCGGNTFDHLPTWSVNGGGTAGNCGAANVVDATTGATKTSWGAVSVTWDGKIGPAGTGTLQPDGTYKLSIQSTWDHGTAGTATNSYTFTKGPSAYSATITTDPNWSNIVLHWLPAVTNPTASFSALTSPVCVGATVNYTNTSSGATSYTWSTPGGTPPSSTSTSVAVSYSAAGIYSVTLIASNGTTTSAVTHTVNVITGPTITVTSPSVCSGSPVVLTASGASSYTWNTGATTSSISVSPTATTFYTVTGSNGTCTSVKTTSVFVVSGPVISVNTPTVCQGSTSVLTASGASTYSWSTGATTFSTSVSPVSTTVFSVIGTSSSCSSSVNATVVVNPTPTVSVNNQTICSGGTATITASGATTYSWNTGFSGNPLIVSPSTSTNYIVTGNSLGCTDTKTVSVTIGTSLTVLISASNNSICLGGNSTLTASGAINYTWSPGGSNSSSIVVSPTVSSTYTLIGKNGSCTGVNTATITIIPTPSFAISTAPSNTVCAGKTVTIVASSPSYTNFVWSSPSGNGSTYTVTPTATTVYSVTASNSAGCSTNSIVAITVKTNPLTTINSSNANCTNPCSGSLTGTTTLGTAPYSYSLSGSGCSSLPCFSLCAGNYTLFTNDGFGCKSTNTFSISAPVNNLTTTVSNTNAACSTCSNGIANVNVTGGTSPYTYTWAPTGGNAATANNLAPACYSVLVSDANGCSSTNTTCVGFVSGIQNKIIVTPFDVLVYPNPTQNNFTIEYTGALFNYAVYNNLGQLIVSENNKYTKANVSINDISKGIYVVVIEIGNSKVRKKLIIE